MTDNREKHAKSCFLTFIPDLSHRISLKEGTLSFKFDSDMKNALIVQPTEGTIIEGPVLACDVICNGKSYVVIKTKSLNMAVNLNFGIDPFDKPPFARLEGVALECANNSCQVEWLVSSSTDGRTWVPSEEQASLLQEEHTAPASQWVTEIEKRLKSMPEELKKLEREAVEEFQSIEMLNTLANGPLTRELAMLHKMVHHFGDEAIGPVLAMTYPHLINNPSKIPLAKEAWKQFEQLAQDPAVRQTLEHEASQLLKEDVESRRRLTELDSLTKTIGQSIKEGPGLVARLRLLGDTPVTMQRTKVEKYQPFQLPQPTPEFALSPKVAQSQKRAMRI